MSSKPSLEAFTQLFAELQEVVDLVARVVAKYPANTLPMKLKPFRGAPLIQIARPSTKGDGEVVIQAQSQTLLSGEYRQLRIPGEWLAMQQSEITVVVRELYWGEARYRDRRELERLTKSIAKHEHQIEYHTKALVFDREAHERLQQKIDQRHP